MKKKREYKGCTNCIIDTSDTSIEFDHRGWCNYCVNFEKNIVKID